MNEATETLYRVHFANAGEWYVDAKSHKQAILNAIDEALDRGYGNNLGAVAVRRAVYKEWNNSANQYRNDGTFIR